MIKNVLMNNPDGRRPLESSRVFLSRLRSEFGISFLTK